LYLLGLQHDDFSHPHQVDVLRAMNLSRGGVELTLQTLTAQGLVQQTGLDSWALTPAGVQAARERTPQNLLPEETQLGEVTR
jgi:DNA-binding IclR family transcriptional regulator